MTMQTKDNITLDMLLDEINDIRERALSNDDYKTALSCTLSKAKLLGLDKPQPQQNEDVRLISELMDELSLESSKPRIIELVAPENVR